MKKLFFVAVMISLSPASFSSPIHFFNFPQDDEEFSFFDDHKEIATEETKSAEENESETARVGAAKDEKNNEQAALDESESWFFSRFSMLRNLDD